MFTPDRAQARRFFFDTWRKLRSGEPLEGLERVAAAVILLHPEYHALLDASDRHLDRDFSPEAGDTNPFLHLSLHLAVEEQLSIDQPIGIRAAYDRLLGHLGDEHAAKHRLLECLGEMIWHAQRRGTGFDASVYFDCLARQEQTGP
jgi:hypothetical protein